MIQKVKQSIKENSLYQKVRFWKDIKSKDFFNAKKLLLFKKVHPFTMSSYQRLSNVYELAESIEKNNIDGAFVECGVWKGGCIAIMAYIAKKFNSGRKIWLFDSFEGLPEPSDKDGMVAKEYAGNRAGGEMATIDKCVGQLEDIKKIFFEILKIDLKNVEIRKGWFQDTLPLAQQSIGPIAILRLDGDWYESTKCCLENLYENVIIGGYIIIDDYGHWEGARKALEEFFIEKNIKPDLIKIDYTGIYFQKP